MRKLCTNFVKEHDYLQNEKKMLARGLKSKLPGLFPKCFAYENVFCF